MGGSDISSVLVGLSWHWLAGLYCSKNLLFVFAIAFLSMNSAWRSVLQAQKCERKLSMYTRRHCDPPKHRRYLLSRDNTDGWITMDPPTVLPRKRKRVSLACNVSSGNTSAKGIKPTPPRIDLEMFTARAKELSSSKLFVAEQAVKLVEDLSEGGVQPKNMEMLCSMLKFSADDQILDFSRRLKNIVGGANYVAVVKAIIYPLVVALKKPASRSIVTAILEIAQNSSRAILSGLLVPLLTEAEGNKAPQIELITRLCKSLSIEFVSSFLNEVVLTMKWEESTMPLLKVFFSIPLKLDKQPVLAGKLVHQMDTHANELRQSLKFSSVVHTFIMKNPLVAEAHQGSLERILLRGETFLSKTTLKLLRKQSK